jgi:hypothetical protein
MSRDPEDNVPAPEVEASAEEQSAARRFAELVDKVQSEQTLPPALDLDDRELLEVAGMISASTNERQLSEERLRSIVDQAVQKALGMEPAEPEQLGESELDRARSRRNARLAGGAVALVCAAAALLFFLRTRDPAAPSSSAPVATNPVRWDERHTSRPADELVGQIPRAEAGMASKRIDRIYSDRMSGYRDLQLQRLGGSQ